MPTQAQISIDVLPAPYTGKSIRVSGEMDEANLTELETILSPLLHEDSSHSFILDLEDLQFINSKVVGYLASAYSTARRMNHKLLIARPTEAIIDILTLVGLDSLIPMFPTIEEALQQLA